MKSICVCVRSCVFNPFAGYTEEKEEETFKLTTTKRREKKLHKNCGLLIYGLLQIQAKIRFD